MNYNKNNEKSNKKGYNKPKFKQSRKKHNKHPESSDNVRNTWHGNYNRQQSSPQRSYYYYNDPNYYYYRSREYAQNQKIWSYPSHHSRSNQEQHMFQQHNVSDIDNDLPHPGSEAERSSKIELDKKRIQEALSSVDIKGDNINTILINEKREKLCKLDKPNEYVPLQELCLTPSDYKDIGSVDTSQVDTVAEVGDNTLNSANYKHPKCNDNKPGISSSNDKIKHPQSSGWRVSDFTEMETDPSPSVQTQTNSISCNKIVNRVDDNQEVRFKGSADTARIGRLYRSFLKSRLSGRAGKISSANKYNLVPNSQQVSSFKLKSAGDQSLASTTVHKNDKCEIEIPLPVQVKIEVNENSYEYNQHDENIEATEADEFCKEFSHLLVHPDYIIPSDVLEKLGLQDLLELSLPLINDKNHQAAEKIEKKKCDNKSDQSQSFNEKSNESLLRVKSVNTLNMTNSRNELFSSSMPVETHLANNIHNTVLSGDINKTGDNSSSSTTLIQTGADKERQSLSRESSTSNCNHNDKGKNV